MSEGDRYRSLVAWLRANHPLVLAEWEREQKELESRQDSERQLLQAPSGRTRSELERLGPDASVADITRAIQRDLEALGIPGGTAGFTPDGTPCVHVIKKGVYGRTYEESVTLARLRDPGYRRHLKQVFG
jgi:hypothetical protein